MNENPDSNVSKNTIVPYGKMKGCQREAIY
jgi:hypothetical protein